MSTLIWKELRENGKWALLALIALTLAEFYALGPGRGGGGDENITLCSSTFLMVTSFGCALVGAAIGTLQILPELRRDQWAGLLHRPLSRTGIFLGKAAAGLCLYFLAAGLPFAASVAYAATPGQFPSPVVPGMTLPGLSDLAFGSAFYFLALFLCLHRGFWFGSRGAIALSAIPLFVVHVSTGWPFLLPLGAAVIFGLAAWGAMLANGPMRDRPVAARVASAAVIFCGCYAAILLAGFLIQLLPGKPSAQVDYSSFVVTKEGQVFISTQKADGSGWSLVTPDGKPVTDQRYLGNDSYALFSQLLPFAWVDTTKTDLETLFSRRFPRLTRNYLRKAERNHDSKENWFYLVDQRIFLGYDKLSRRSVGSLDDRGFHPAGESARSPFPLTLQTSPWANIGRYLFWAGPRLYAFEFDERNSEILLDAAGESIFGAMAVSPDREDSKLIAVALTSGLKILDQSGKPIFSVPYRYDVSVWGQLLVATNAAEDRIYLQYGRNYWGSDPSPAVNKTYLTVYDLQGNLLETFGHAGSNFSRQAPSWVTVFLSRFSPPVPALIASSYRALFPPAFPIMDFRTYPTPSFVLPPQEIGVLFGVSLIFALITYFWAVKTGLSAASAWKWALFVLCFNLPALLTFRLTADWPVRERCPQCGSRRSVEDNNCGSCHEAWAKPAASGSEIFDFPTEQAAGNY